MNIDKITREQIQTLLKNPEEYIECLVKFSSVRGLMQMLYIEYVTAKKITPLEAIPEKNRREVWEQAKKDAAGRLTKENTIVLAKAFYLINFLLLEWELNSSK